jgi:hypothetical protein
VCQPHLSRCSGRRGCIWHIEALFLIILKLPNFHKEGGFAKEEGQVETNVVGKGEQQKWTLGTHPCSLFRVK